ncbi:MAG: NrdH-redoxin [Candidatus Tagabacteria bacterium RIFCSPLOWO2_01_FULL_39_11]|uniref:NrdH-redoxin n=1 Tax=Candidatus Tagabacteria bacterium RIFCSPLOWO2_01_FULL_39_11 TaxID=1802295 RepID=A0A1G2LNZ4_9BACT|nr:MAG: NrdH-redoxin [Candidatus Tagabacteria bacterium RIFCSPLOWO2_01_FULL_39_11]
MKKVKIYTTPSCVYCRQAKEFFKEKGVGYEEFDVSVNAEKREEVIQKSGQMGVPVVDIEGEIIVGFDKNKISGLLELS